MWRIYIDDCQDLDFVFACLFCQPIDLKEIKLWADEVIRTTAVENIPDYIFDLSEFNDSLLGLDELIGFVSHGDLSDKDIDSLYGIAFARGVDLYDSPVTRKEALRALKNNPKILDEFKRFFPFIKLPEIPIEE